MFPVPLLCQDSFFDDFFKKRGSAGSAKKTEPDRTEPVRSGSAVPFGRTGGSVVHYWSHISMPYFWNKSTDKTTGYTIICQKYPNIFIPTSKWPPNSLCDIFILLWAQGFFTLLDEMTSNSKTLTLRQFIFSHNV